MFWELGAADLAVEVRFYRNASSPPLFAIWTSLKDLLEAQSSSPEMQTRGALWLPNSEVRIWDASGLGKSS